MSQRRTRLAVAWRTMLLLLGLTGALGCAGPHARYARPMLEVHAFGIDSTNVYLVVQGSSTVLIDSGYEKNAPRLDHELRSAGFDPATLRAIVLTHGHADHAGGARYFQQRYHTKVVAGEGDRAMLGQGKNEPLCPTGTLGRLRRATDQSATYTPLSADVWVSAELDLRSVAGIDGKIVPLPGHTSGSLVVLAGDVALVGDLFRGGIAGSSAEQHLYMCDVEGNRRDIVRLLDQLAPAATLFFVGHFGPVGRAQVADRFSPSQVKL